LEKTLENLLKEARTVEEQTLDEASMKRASYEERSQLRDRLADSLSKMDGLEQEVGITATSIL
jgi:hypothetical protein